MNDKEINLVEESKIFTLRCFIVIITTIYFFIAYKIINKRISYLLNIYDVKNIFSNLFGEINILNTIFVMILLYFFYFIGKKLLSYIFKENFEITNLTTFFVDSF